MMFKGVAIVMWMYQVLKVPCRDHGGCSECIPLRISLLPIRGDFKFQTKYATDDGVNDNQFVIDWRDGVCSVGSEVQECFRMLLVTLRVKEIVL